MDSMDELLDVLLDELLDTLKHTSVGELTEVREKDAFNRGEEI